MPGSFKEIGTQTAASSAYQALEMYYPGIINLLNQGGASTAVAQAGQDAKAQAVRVAKDYDLWQTYGPLLAGVSDQIQAQSAKAAAQTELDILNGPGREKALAAAALQDQVDPAAAATRDALAAGYQKLLTGTDPNQLTGAEREEIARAIGAQGRANPNSNQDTVARAMTFGSALQNKQALFSQIAGSIATGMPALRSGIDAYGTAVARATPSTAGQDRYNADSITGAGDTGYQVGSQAQGMNTQFASNWQNVAGSGADFITQLGKIWSITI